MSQGAVISGRKHRHVSKSVWDNSRFQYPAQICFFCAGLAGKSLPPGHLATFHEGACDLCGEVKAVTVPRDFGHLTAENLRQIRETLAAIDAARRAGEDDNAD